MVITAEQRAELGGIENVGRERNKGWGNMKSKRDKRRKVKRVRRMKRKMKMKN